MKKLKYIFLIIIVLAACNPHSHNNEPNINKTIADYDSVYLIADVQWHKQFYPLLERQLFSIDLLSDGLSFDSTHHIVGTGCNLYLSDIFLPINQTYLQNGTYTIDTTAGNFTFLPYMNFEGEITGCYLLDIQENKIQRIIGFTAGKMQLSYINKENIHIDLSLYTADSTHYHAIYQGPANYK